MNMFCAKHCVKGQSNDSVHPTSKAVHFDIASPRSLAARVSARTSAGRAIRRDCWRAAIPS